MFQISTNFLVTEQMRDLSIFSPVGSLWCIVMNPTDKVRINHTFVHWFFLPVAKQRTQIIIIRESKHPFNFSVGVKYEIDMHFDYIRF